MRQYYVLVILTCLKMDRVMELKWLKYNHSKMNINIEFRRILYSFLPIIHNWIFVNKPLTKSIQVVVNFLAVMDLIFVYYFLPWLSNRFIALQSTPCFVHNWHWWPIRTVINFRIGCIMQIIDNRIFLWSVQSRSVNRPFFRHGFSIVPIRDIVYLWKLLVIIQVWIWWFHFGCI